MSKREGYLNELKDELAKYAHDLSDIKEDIKRKTSGNFTKAFEAAQTALKEATKAYESLKSAAEDDWEDLVQSTTEVFSKLSTSFQELSRLGFDRLSELPEQLQKQLKSYVKSNPFASLMIALGIGIILGKRIK